MVFEDAKIAQKMLKWRKVGRNLGGDKSNDHITLLITHFTYNELHSFHTHGELRILAGMRTVPYEPYKPPAFP